MNTSKTMQSHYINSFSTQLRKLLKDNHLTQQQLADSVGVSLNAVNDWINEKSQPKWLLQMFGTMQFFYENVVGFNPLQLFYMEDHDSEDILQTTIEKNLEQEARAKVEEEYKVKLEKRVSEIRQRAKEEIDRVKAKYKVYQIDTLLEEKKQLLEETRKLEQQVKGTKGRQDYTQFKEKLEKKYKELEREFEGYKEAYNGLSLAELSDEEFMVVSDSLKYKNAPSYGKMRMKKVLTNPEFFRLLKKVFDNILFNNPQLTFEEIGKDFYRIVRNTVSYGLIITANTCY